MKTTSALLWALLMARFSNPGYVPRDPQIPEVRFKNTAREQARRVKQLIKQQEGKR